MATSLGRVYLSGCNYELAYDLISQSVENNTSSVRLYGILHVTNNYISWSSGSASVHTSGLQAIGTYYSRGDHTLITRDFTFTHDGNGNFSTYIGASLSTTFVSGDCGGTLTLPNIPRQANITSAPNFNDEQNPTIQYSNPLGNNANELKACISLTGITDDVPYRDISKTGNSYTFELTNEERDTLRNATTTSKTRTIKFFVLTKIGNNTYYSIAERTLTIINGNPTFSEAYKDTNATTLAITNNNQQIIRNNSTLEINLTNMTALKGATLSSAKAIIDGTTYNGTISGTTCTINVGTINLANNTTASVVVTDSRSYSTTHDLPITILDWQLPTGIITLERQSNYYSESDIKVDANYSNLDNKNQITIKTRYKKVEDSTYGAYVTLQDNVTSVLTLDNLYSWDVQVLVEDLIGSTTYNLSLGIGLPILFVDRLKRSVGVECFPKNNNSLEVNGKAIDFGTILWTNPNPTSSFSAQSVNLIESLDNFDAYSIIHRQSTSNSRYISTGKIPVGHGTFMANPLATNQYRGTNENTSGSSITFTAGYRANADGTFTEDNTLVIPMYVIGYKTGLF